MTALVIVTLIISLTEVPSMINKNQKKELTVFAVIAILALGLGAYHLMSPTSKSISEVMLGAYENIIGGGTGK